MSILDCILLGKVFVGMLMFRQHFKIKKFGKFIFLKARCIKK